MGREQPLAAARVSQAAFDAIEAAMFVRGVKMQAVLAPVIEAFGEDLMKDPAVIAALAVRAKYSGGGQGNVAHLPKKG